MAKETTIVFVYDTELLKKEDDDPNNAILYFFPTWVSDQQKTALCGQIIGTIICLKSIFSMPKVVSLQTGKFFLVEDGRYILAIGTDRNIPDWVLEYRANLLYSLVNFFHRDFQNLAEMYQNEKLSAKLYHMFDTYLKMIFYGGNVFSHIPSLCLPKNGSSVFTDAITFLESCREYSNVLGGTILYHNKIVTTQLSISTTKKLVLCDPYRIKNPAEILETDFDPPLGVQLLQVYITNKEFCSLLETSLRNRCIFQYLNNKSIKKPHAIKQQTQQSYDQSNSIMSVLKKDTSLLFTAVPEEDSVSPTSEASVTQHQHHVMQTQKKSRPKFLNLKALSLESNEPKANNKMTPITPFCGQTSVASTPMTELKRFVHQNPLSLVDKNEFCIYEPDEQRNFVKQEQNLEQILDEKYPKAQKSSEERILEQDTSSLKKYYLCNGKQGTSLLDLAELINSISKYPNQYSNLKDKLHLSPEKSIKLKSSKTIHDPIHPIFKSDGTVASQNYFEESLKESFLGNAHGFVRKGSIKSLENNFESIDYASNESDNPFERRKIQNLPEKINQEYRKSLTLPLKSWNTNESSNYERKFSSGVQLTPLLSKLTMLAFEEKKSSKEIKTPYGLTSSKDCFNSNFKSKVKILKPEGDNVLQKCALFICGQQDVVLGLLMKEECCRDKETLNKLWELCTEHLPKLEKQINFCLESQNSGTAPQESEPYSLLCLDSDWDTVKRGGPWNTSDLNCLVNLHGDFIEKSDITEILLRHSESVIYSYHSSPSEVFYHENAPMANGLLAPSDPIGVVQLKAKRRLERDHAIVLL